MDSDFSQLVTQRWRHAARLLTQVTDRAPALAPITDRLLALIRYRISHGRWANFIRPKTFNEKLVRKRLFDRRPYLTQTADKLAVREYVASIVGHEYLSKVHAVTDRFEDLDLQSLPGAYVVKPTHGSGRVRIVTAPQDLEGLLEESRGWLRERWPVWNRAIPPRLMVEEFLGDPGRSEPPPDYKFFVMNGQVEIVQVDASRFSGHRRAIYNTAWERLPVEYKSPPAQDVPPPVNLRLMVDLAARLGRDTDFVRVDFYDLDDRVVFGEMTHSPEAATGRFQPASFDTWLGGRWSQPRHYKTHAAPSSRYGDDTTS